MSKANHATTMRDAAQPSRRAIVSSAFGLALAASVAGDAIGDPALSSSCSADIAAAFAKWQKSVNAWDAALAADDAANARFEALLPGVAGWPRPLTSEQKAAINAARELSGEAASEQACFDACEAEENLFRAFLSVPPRNMADVMLQSKHLKEWCHMAEMELPVELWLSALTGEAWPSEASEMEAV